MESEHIILQMSQKGISKCGVCYLQGLESPIKYFCYFLANDRCKIHQHVPYCEGNVLTYSRLVISKTFTDVILEHARLALWERCPRYSVPVRRSAECADGPSIFGQYYDKG